MDISVENCNNIDNGTITLKEHSLNIKYAINGTGKSTISKAIIASINDQQKGSKELLKLKPFKYIDSEGNYPSVTGIDSINLVKVFDEEYTNKYIFLPDELVQGSFDIFIRDEEYEKGMAEINELTKIIQEMFAQDKDIDELINDFNELSSSFGKPVKSGIHGSSNISKAFKSGNKVRNVPKEVEDYKEYIQSESNIKWIKWIIDGKVYLNLSDNCPYCITNISTKKEKIAKISDIYEPKVIEYLNKIVSVFSRLNKYFSDSTKTVVDTFISSVDGYTDEQVRYLLEIKEQIDNMNKKFNDAKYIGFRSLKDVDKVIEQLKNQRIDITYYSHLQAPATKEKIGIVNKSIDALLERAGILQGKVNLQKKHIEKVIKENKEEINDFLRNAGFDYSVDIVEDAKKNYSIKLIHKDRTGDSVEDVRDHLSFGERNAFAIVLFMYDALKSKPDLIILDDPISSFDKNKKYAIIHILFGKGKGFSGKTVLMLTHDFEPIIDMVYHHRDRFDVPSAYFMENFKGQVREKEVKKENISTFLDICEANTKRDVNDITKLVYLRRKYEILNEKGNTYHLLSNLLHKRDEPIIPSEMNRKMTPEEIEDGTKQINNESNIDFDYSRILKSIKDDAYLKRLYKETDCNYEKLHIYRVLCEDRAEGIGSNVINKFINQAFHVENEYIYQLNPCEFQLVPQYVIDECDKQIGEY
jgi:energy-coupling factor transporter ATP-binding protein EcfA2